MRWMDRWAARAQRKSDEHEARWQARQRARALTGQPSFMDRWAARAQRKSDERAARWLAAAQQPYRPPRRPPRPPGRYLLLSVASFVIMVASASTGSAAMVHHVHWLSRLMTLPAAAGFVGFFAGLLGAVEAWRTRRWLPPGPAGKNEDPPDRGSPSKKT